VVSLLLLYSSSIVLTTLLLYRLFERAIDTIGSDFLAHPLWDRYIEFETSQEEFNHILEIYSRVLLIPLKNLSQYWERFQQFVESSAVFNPQSKIELVSSRAQSYQNTKQELERISEFETGVIRPYFHVQPLSASEVNAWRSYLDNEEVHASEDRVIKLYERCLVACCLYVEFWKRYAFYLQSKKRIEDTRSVLTRAATIFLKRIPAIHVTLAEFEEQHGSVNQAIHILNSAVSGIGKGNVETIVKAVHLFRRNNLHDEAIRLLVDEKQHVDNEHGKQILEVQRALYLANIVHDLDKAREIFNSAVTEYPSSKHVWSSYIEFELKHLGDKDWNTSVKPLFERFIQQNEVEDKALILEKYYNMLTHYGSSVADLHRVEQLLLKLKVPKQNPKKRKAEEEVNGDSAKIPKVDGSAAYNQWYQQQMAGYNPQAYAQYYQQQQQQTGSDGY
jgi:pre-mRNA-processing factor 39